MSSLIDPLIECWMVDNALLSDNNFVVLVVYLVHRLKKLMMSYMSTPLFDTGLTELEVPDLAQPIIGSGY